MKCTENNSSTKGCSLIKFQPEVFSSEVLNLNTKFRVNSAMNSNLVKTSVLHQTIFYVKKNGSSVCKGFSGYKGVMQL